MKSRQRLLPWALALILFTGSAGLAQAPPIPLALNNRWIYEVRDVSYGGITYDTLTVIAFTVSETDQSKITWTLTSSARGALQYVVYQDTILITSTGHMYVPFDGVPATLPSGQQVFRSNDTVMTPLGTFFQSDVYELVLEGESPFVIQERVVPGIGVIGASSVGCNAECWGSTSTLIGFSGTATGVKELSHPPTFLLSSNYPNPFNPTTAISYQFSAVSNVTLKIFDVLGREVATLVNEEQPPGTYQATWDATGFPSGVYFCRLSTGGFVETRKLILQK